MTTMLTTTIPSGRVAVFAPSKDETDPAQMAVLETVRIAARMIAPSRVWPSAPHLAPGSDRPQGMLILLTYGLARQIYSSAEMLNHAICEEALFDLCAGTLPEVAELQRFRQDNREIIEICLVHTLTMLVGRRIAAGRITRTNPQTIRAEAKRRIIMTAFVDSLEAAAWQTSMCA